jgi:hypothetical protein
MTHAASTRRSSVLWIHAALMAAMTVAVVQPVVAQDTRTGRRVRSESARIADAIAQGTEGSGTFRGLVATIDTTDGLVYVEEGECGHAVRACLVLSVTVAGPNRVLRILVNVRKAPGCELVEVIGHELQHAVEVLREGRIRSNGQIYHFFDGIGPTGFGRFETKAALDAGLDVAYEACRRPVKAFPRDAGAARPR